MLPITSSTMGLFRFGFLLLLLIGCIISITSYRIEHRPFEDRNERAVTEWRFRRNYLLSLPYYHDNYIPDESEVMENENTPEGYGKNYLHHLFYDRMNK